MIKARQNNEGDWTLDGVADFGYYAKTLYPSNIFSTEEDAEAAGRAANNAYKQGYEKAQDDIRKALGMNDES